MPYSLFVCVDRGAHTRHDWYRAPALDGADHAWLLTIAQALPEAIYVGRVGTDGEHEWLVPNDHGIWGWSGVELEVPPARHRQNTRMEGSG